MTWEVFIELQILKLMNGGQDQQSELAKPDWSSWKCFKKLIILLFEQEVILKSI